MNKYAILANPGHNRIYFESSKKLSISELNIALELFPFECKKIKVEYIEDIFYIIFETEKELSIHELKIISKLSFIYALFEVIKIDNSEFLKPIKLIRQNYMNDSISCILKYTGKTNELFTRMMINVGVLSSDCCKDNIKILDPIAGKGTTLFESLIFGYDAYGIEISDKSAVESYNFIKKYLQLERYKHNTFSQNISGPNKSFKAKRFEIDFAKTKEDFKNNNSRHFELVCGNSLYADKYYKKNMFDVLVGDLPYGIQHGNITNQKQSSLTRNPAELVSNCIDAWKYVLKPGGALVLAWNSFVFSRDKFANILTEAGLFVLNDEPYLGFEHRVDQSIKRDIIVAKKK